MSINATVDGTFYEGIQTISVGGKSIALSEVGGSGEITRATWHQCPEAARNYLAYVSAHPYSESDHSTTAVLDYAPNPANQSNTKPIGYTIDGATFYDNEPLVATPFATQNRAGTLTALDKLRWYNTVISPKSGNDYDKGWNCRDLGGWACDGGTIKYGMLVRSGEINPLDKELMVGRVGIKTEVNLLPLREQATDYSVWGIERIANPTNNDIQYSLTYTDQWKLYLQGIMQSVARSKPVIFHCGVGADKTGTLAVMLMGLLGCAMTDIDTDYELTTFMHWTDWRNRTLAGYIAYINAIKAVPLKGGLSNTFRNHCVSFALSLGISIDEINAFRIACINGTPDVITVVLPTYTVSKSGSHVAYDNDTATVSENNPYSVGVTPASGYVISDVSVTMGGTDITSQVFSGTPTVRRVGVTNNLLHCSTSNSANVVEAGAAYTATITAAEGYTLDGASVSITMGGLNVSQYYSNGTISIPSVTGNVVISVTAVESARENLFDPSKATYNARIATAGDLRTSEQAAMGRMLAVMLDISNISTLLIEGVTEVADPDGRYVRIGLYNSDTISTGSFIADQNYSAETYSVNVASLKSANPTATYLALQLSIAPSGTAVSAADVANLAIYGS